MTDKEKAKYYDEAIERIKKLYGNEITEEIFPELKKDDTERIRKNCIHFLELQKQHHAATFEIEECIDWLENQGKQASAKTNERAWLYLVSDVLTWQDGIGQYLDDPRVQELAKRLCKEYEQKLYNPSNIGKNEQKSVDKIEPKFNVGDWVVDNCGYVWKIKGIVNQFYILESVEGDKSCPTIDWVDKTFHLWTIQDAKDGDVLATYAGAFIYNGNNGGGSCPGSYCGINTLGRFQMGAEHHWTGKKVYPATKEQHDALMKAMNNDGYEWDIEKKELNKKVK